MGGIGVSSIILIVVSTLLLVCVVFIAVLLVGRKRGNRNSGGDMGNTYDVRKSNFSPQDNYRDFTVLEKAGEPKKKQSGFFPTDEESSETVSIGVENSFGGGNDPFYGEAHEDSDKTEMMLDVDNFPSKPHSYGHSDNVTIQYSRNGIMQNYRMKGQYAVIGRDPGCDIIIDSDSYMSEQHAILYIKNRTIYIGDLSSKNGTYVNDKRIKGAVRLSSSDNVKVASSGIKVII